MKWEPIERWGNRAQLPLTLGGYIGWAYMLWPKGAVLFGHPSHMNWQATLAAFVAVVGLVSFISQVANRFPWLSQSAAAAPLKEIKDQATADALIMRMLRQEDANRMPERFHIEQPFGVHGAPHLSAIEPYIEFSVGIRNSSVFSLRMEREIEGRLRMDDQELGRASNREL